MISHYSADDTDDRDEYTNYWRKWEQSERYASMTFCDFQSSCWDCPNAFCNSEYSDIEACPNTEPIHGLAMVLDNTQPDHGYRIRPVIRNNELEWWHVRIW